MRYGTFEVHFIKQYCSYNIIFLLAWSSQLVLVLVLDWSVLLLPCVRLIFDKSAKDAVAEPLFAGFACNEGKCSRSTMV